MVFLKRRDPQVCTFGVLGLSCETPVPMFVIFIMLLICSFLCIFNCFFFFIFFEFFTVFVFVGTNFCFAIFNFFKLGQANPNATLVSSLGEGLLPPPQTSN